MGFSVLLVMFYSAILSYVTRDAVYKIKLVRRFFRALFD